MMTKECCVKRGCTPYMPGCCGCKKEKESNRRTTSALLPVKEKDAR